VTDARIHGVKGCLVHEVHVHPRRVEPLLLRSVPKLVLVLQVMSHRRLTKHGDKGALGCSVGVHDLA